MAITRYTLAVNRRFKREGQPDADFINCVSFGKAAEFSQKYFKKGMMVCVSGRIQVSTYDKDGTRQYYTDIILDEQDFAEKKRDSASDAWKSPTTAEAMPATAAAKSTTSEEIDFFDIDADLDDEDLPF